jgi:hypothetical protein
MKISIVQWSLLLITAATSTWLNLWAGLTTVFTLTLALLLLWRLHRGASTSAESRSADEERLILAATQLRANPYEGEIFGFNSRVQNDIREIIGALGQNNKISEIKVDWNSILPALTIGLQTLVNLSVILWSGVRFDQWGIIALVLLPSLTYPLLSKLSLSRK